MTPAQESRQLTATQLRGVNRDQRTVDIVASTFDLDSHGTRIDPKGWDFEQFKKNPVICLQHDSYGREGSSSHGLPIANAVPETIRVENGKLVMRVRFPKEGTFPLADTVFNLVCEGFMHGISVGFDPDMEAVEQVTEDDAEGRSQVVHVFRKQRLMEVSFVTIPSNDNGMVQRQLKKLNREGEREKFVEMAGRVEELAIRVGNDRHAADEAQDDEPVRWNRSLSSRFDVAEEKIKPSALVYDWVAKHVGCEVKHVFQNSFFVPSFRIGGVLSGLKQARSGNEPVDVRNLTWGGAEEPPVYNVIQLNSRQSDDFLIDGIAFFRSVEGNFAYRVYPVWGGLHVDVFTHRDAKDFNRRMVDEAWRHARENNPLKGEAFALSGEFIRKTDETWDDCFLEEKNAKALTRVVDRLNEKGKETPNRGVLMLGPPGTGKTLSGRIIRNTLKDCSFIWVSTRDFHYGGGFTQAFELAREIAPSVLFFEDIDNWVGGNIDLLKTEMDGIARSSGVVTIMTTNFPENLPEALIDRPGRFHDVLNFNLPTDDKRAAMLRKWVSGLSAADVEDAVGKTKGYSGAHMYELASFACNLMEADDLSVSDALREALKKVEEQKDLITKVQLQGSNYRPRRMRGVRAGEKSGIISSEMDALTHAPADVEKWKTYFERKQPANRESTKVLKRFFKDRGEEQPSDEAEAWERMAEILAGDTTVVTQPATTPATETSATDVPATPEPEKAVLPETPAESETKEDPQPAEEPKPEEPMAPAEPVVEKKQEEPTPPPSNPEAPAAAAPQPERALTPAAPAKRVIHISPATLRALPAVIGQALADRAAEALRSGMPPKDLDGFLDAEGTKLLASVIHS